MEEQNLEKVVEAKSYSQEEYDNAIAGTKKRMEKKIEKEYVSREEYDELASKYNDLQVKSKTPHIKDMYMKNGGREDAFNDYVKLNSNLFEAKNDEELSKMINDTKQKSGYMFNQTYNATINQGTPNDKKNEVNGYQFLGDTLVRIK